MTTTGPVLMTARWLAQSEQVWTRYAVASGRFWIEHSQAAKLADELRNAPSAESLAAETERLLARTVRVRRRIRLARERHTRRVVAYARDLSELDRLLREPSSAPLVDVCEGPRLSP